MTDKESITLAFENLAAAANTSIEVAQKAISDFADSAAVALESAAELLRLLCNQLGNSETMAELGKAVEKTQTQRRRCRPCNERGKRPPKQYRAEMQAHRKKYIFRNGRSREYKARRLSVNQRGQKT